ncbi:ABC transporter permease [Amycolatopsis cihanbeyliensis]|uniref:Transport permease protein n=1 Tax=Amycolatopsis cihanbeyliensis TaxID=1128664 RepID=A0A542DE58_AMYCI|nr:ABC transporter permease [Amycolatopsis cihanbeyliensis]TQJ01350.1 ABC transporter DrrB family efflux protein [Amycolatopsis cihanbeyliensis]
MTAMNLLLSDSAALIGRHLRHTKRVPQKLISATIMPVAMVVIFGYLFGSSMQVPGGDYKEYIMPGIFTMVMLAGISTTAVGVATDLHNGLVDRFRSLPISHVSVLIGRTVSDLVTTVISCMVMTAVGYLIGWRISGGVLAVLGGFLLIFLLGLAMAWLGAWIGLAMRNAEAVNAIGSFVTMPLAFLSAAFFPLSNLPGWLRTVAEWNPVSAVTTAAREMWGNPTGIGADAGLPVRNPVLFSLLGLAVLFAIAVPKAVRAFQRAAAR